MKAWNNFPAGSCQVVWPNLSLLKDNPFLTEQISTLSYLNKSLFLSNKYIYQPQVQCRKSDTALLKIWTKPGIKITFRCLTLYTLTSVCIFSTLFFIHFLRCWQGEFVCQSKDFFPGDHFLSSHNLNVWFRSEL